MRSRPQPQSGYTLSESQSHAAILSQSIACLPNSDLIPKKPGIELSDILDDSGEMKQRAFGGIKGSLMYAKSKSLHRFFGSMIGQRDLACQGRSGSGGSGVCNKFVGSTRSTASYLGPKPAGMRCRASARSDRCPADLVFPCRSLGELCELRIHIVRKTAKVFLDKIANVQGVIQNERCEIHSEIDHL
jgi:hypothetical protein